MTFALLIEWKKAIVGGKGWGFDRTALPGGEDFDVFLPRT